MLNKQLNKQSWGWWFETQSWSLWGHCNVTLPYLDSCANCGILVISSPRDIQTNPTMKMCSNALSYTLTHWGRDKMNAISQTTYSNAFSSRKIFELRLNFHLILFPRVQLIIQLLIFQHGFRWWLGAAQATNHYLNQWWFVYRRIYATLGLDELSTNV